MGAGRYARTSWTTLACRASSPYATITSRGHQLCLLLTALSTLQGAMLYNVVAWWAASGGPSWMVGHSRKGREDTTLLRDEGSIPPSLTWCC